MSLHEKHKIHVWAPFSASKHAACLVPQASAQVMAGQHFYDVSWFLLNLQTHLPTSAIDLLSLSIFRQNVEDGE